MQAGYYTDKLYPLQDRVLQQVASCGSPFYLTGGTALSREYLHHRYSDDLDFFVNQDPGFISEVKKIITLLGQSFLVRQVVLDASYVQLKVTENDVDLKVEFVNDVLFHADGFRSSSLFNKIDSWKNILSNKITALGRNEGKDIADILWLSEFYLFNWKEIISSAQNKDTWVDEINVSQAINDFDILKLKKVRWINEPEWDRMPELLSRIAKDILLGTDNSLFKR